MAKTFKYMIGRDGNDEEADDYIVSDSIVKSTNSVDTMTVYCSVDPDERHDIKAFLLDNWIKKVRVEDGFVTFRGEIKEVRLESSDEYNLMFKVKAHTYVLADLNIDDYTATIRTPDAKVTARDSDSITFNGTDGANYGAEPGGYVTLDNAVMIVPNTTPSKENSDNESITPTNCVITGTFDLINEPRENGVYIRAVPDGNQTTFTVECRGSSGVAKAALLSFNCYAEIQLKGHIDRTSIMYVEYYDNDGATWVEIESMRMIGITNIYGGWWKPVHRYSSTETNDAGGHASVTTELLDGSDDWKIRYRMVYSDTVSATTGGFILFINLVTMFSDPYFSAASYPITSYGDTTHVHVNVNPLTTGVNVGDVYGIAKRDGKKQS